MVGQPRHPEQPNSPARTMRTGMNKIGVWGIVEDWGIAWDAFIVRDTARWGAITAINRSV